MDEASIQRIENSFELLARRGPELVDRFFAQLFARHPVVRPLFPTDMTWQKAKLSAALGLVVRSLRQPDALRSMLIELGKRHAGYGAQPEYYGAFRDTLLEVMAELAGSDWSEQLTADWTNALNLVTEVMLEGQRAATAAGVNP